MSIVGLLVGLIIIALVFWAVRALLGAFAVPEPVATVVWVVLVILVIVWLLQTFTGIPAGMRLTMS